jgi:hypothetical protein
MDGGVRTRRSETRGDGGGVVTDGTTDCEVPTLGLNYPGGQL